MAKFSKIEVISAMASTGMVPVFYNKDIEISKNVLKACYDGGVRAFEFTNRGDLAHEPRVHDVAAPVEQTAQVAGKDPVTQTPNPKALFKMNKGGADEPDNAGNPRAPEGEDKASGTGPGLNPDGLDQLDQDLKKRGLVGVLPLPEQPENKSGVVLIRVTVDASGRVTSAAYEPKGSTTSDVELVAEARKAALRTRFTESRTVIEGGVITYIFKLTAE